MNVNVWKAAIISALCAVLTAAVLLCGGICWLLAGKAPQKNVGVLLVAAVYVAAGVGGLVAAAFKPGELSKGALVGAILYMVAIILISLPFGQGFSFVKLLVNGLGPCATMVLVANYRGNRRAHRRLDPQKKAKQIGKSYKRKYKIR